MSANHNGKINEALELLNEAAASKRDEILKLITHKYSDLRDVVESTKEKAEAALHEGRMRMKKTARQVDKTVHKNPWAFIGGAAAATLLLGFVLGRGSKKD